MLMWERVQDAVAFDLNQESMKMILWVGYRALDSVDHRLNLKERTNKVKKQKRYAIFLLYNTFIHVYKGKTQNS